MASLCQSREAATEDDQTTYAAAASSLIRGRRTAVPFPPYRLADPPDGHPELLIRAPANSAERFSPMSYNVWRASLGKSFNLLIRMEPLDIIRGVENLDPNGQGFAPLLPSGELLLLMMPSA